MLAITTLSMVPPQRGGKKVDSFCCLLWLVSEGFIFCPEECSRFVD